MIKNPYAKRKPPPQSSSETPEATKPLASIAPPAIVRHHNNTTSTTNGATTFSQAFEAVEDTIHYQNQCTEISVQQQQQQAERAQQRALEHESALTDRDHHVFLQPQLRLCVSTRQRGNGILQHIRNVPYSFETMVPDYIMGTQRCALFLSCKYHSLHPTYIEHRTAELKQDFALRVLLVLVDDNDASKTLQFLNAFCARQRLTMILAWSEEEAARYLETFQAMDGKDASLIQKRKDTNAFGDQVADFLSKASVNKTDAAQLMAQFSNVRAIGQASMDELATVSGMGHVKVKRLWDAFHKPFSSEAAAKRRKALLESSAAKGDDAALNTEESTDKNPKDDDGMEPGSSTVEEVADAVEKDDLNHESSNL
ncbi:DNA excision repair protein ERCC-1 [Fistulifera solaris]|uniref:DNA excision repair protein ERCC-1 n=1 Tax=Fistulifera solaris TaxID=1519565 RepID=A0A1Z5JZD6_FISSO|nr:DNA excision repair protein ERCC-1 [Fistulifera solaris]|eukprot:GAX19198.1 DNA excision repair protein ERCC-1 [Fistulifera solaris]